MFASPARAASSFPSGLSAPGGARARRRVVTRVLALGSAMVAAGTLSSCGQPVTVDPAPSATAPACANVMLSLPQEMDGMAKRRTTSQATAAWGDPAAVVLRCGTSGQAPTSDPCTTVGGVDWIAHDQGHGRYRLTAYGRTPGIQVELDTKRASSATVASSLRDAVQQLPAERTCKAATEEP